MQTLFTFATPPGQCGYLPDRTWSLRYDIVGKTTPAEYGERLRAGWRRFGHSLFRPQCPTCTACQSLRVDVARFVPSRTQARVRKKNAGAIALTVTSPSVTPEKLALYDRFHAFQSDFKGWPGREPETVADYAESFLDNPFDTEEWQYHVGDRLVGVGYVDVVPDGLSAIYFYHEPDFRDRSLGVWNVLEVIRSATERGLPFVYMGFHVEGCRSLEYKAAYRPNEALDAATGTWRPFAERGVSPVSPAG